ncbi:branched-chain amino acid ABC transporter substrate-binding protein [Skermanella stibiiresistens SB22]|uniref:Branched-chain amino acid ABC transporter substrate-binding protein n=1 Tax=Skermanella stibiiresistens SB22 TaxID=1385369 RepID=W9GUZ6_9PROT|nr:ABC transporter ATP-binding protein [Skermanella stibiiresistens]EWY36257.1 branched-chain amino acid ABC transporter substrate-binding protein [Skermanella stibiiresistens SB22]
MSLLEVKGLVKRFGGLLATDNLDLTIKPGELHAIIGPNGAGKTTLISQLSGTLRPTEGSILLEGRDITRWPVHRRAALGLARSYQITSVFTEFTVIENVMLAVQARSGSSFSFWTNVHSDAALVEPARDILRQVGLLDVADVPVARIAHGGRRQLEIAMSLAMAPRLLLLDEPMAGMSHSESKEMVTLLRRLKGQYGILLVEHDMSAVFALADRITVLVYGKPIACGRPEEIRKDKAVRAAYLGEEEIAA